MEFGVTANCELVGHSMKLRVGFALENVGLRLLYLFPTNPTQSADSSPSFRIKLTKDP